MSSDLGRQPVRQNYIIYASIKIHIAAVVIVGNGFQSCSFVCNLIKYNITVVHNRYQLAEK